MAEFIDPVLIPLPESAIPSMNNSPPESLRLPHIPVHPPPGVAPLPRFRSERLLPAPNMIYPLPPTFAKLHVTPQCPALQGQVKSFHSPYNSGSRTKPRISPDRFIPTNTSINAFRMSMPLHLLSHEEKLLRRSTRNDIFGRGRSMSPPFGRQISSSIDYRAPRAQASGITAAGRAIYVGAGSSRGTEVYINIFGDQESPEVEKERHQSRLAAALGVDRCARVLSFTREPVGVIMSATVDIWSRGSENYKMGPRKSTAQNSQTVLSKNTVPTTPFRVLDAPGLRDDYYCSLLAYSPVAHSLAVGLHSDVYTWTETTGATPFKQWSSSHVTCLAFSCTPSRRNILAIGRIDGNLCLWKPGEPKPRIERKHTAGVACVCWRPVLQKRWDASFSAVTPNDEQMLPRLSSSWIDCEDLLVGDEMGIIYYYTVSWSSSSPPYTSDRRIEAGGAKIRLLKKITAHTQQICGLCWSGDGGQFATGGNDNVACLFNVSDIFAPPSPDESREIKMKRERGKYRWTHGAAVKAMAFCPWQRTLLATGGGSNDRCIHFYHTYSGACLATINVSAQVTSLLWSNSHREIAATFGYANPDHPIRIAVFSWPECKQVAAIPWGEDMRALYAVGYPGGPIEGSIPESPHEDVDEYEDVNDSMEDNSEEEWMILERRVLAQGVPTDRTVATRSGANSRAVNGAGSREAEARRGRPTLVSPMNTPIPTTTAARTNTASRSRSRGRTATRTGEVASPSEGVPARARNSSSATQVSSLRRRRTRSGRGAMAPRGDRSRGAGRHSDGCIVVAASDETVRFHEVWSECRKGVVGWRGVLGGSDILEGLEGIEKDGGETIR
ncbi:WD40-repeat-containing domain protein [Kalaharituber pfeilii]|nr:WD40-repeat-containing domain protein [Kalaharituber pfeilii]